MNRGELRTLVYDYVQDINQDRWTTTSVNQQINLCYKEFARITGLTQKVVSASVFAGTNQLTFNTVNVTKLRELFIPNCEDIGRISVQGALDGYGANFEDEVGTPEVYIWPYDQQVVSSVVRPVLLLVPKPTVSYDGSTAARTVRAYVEYEPADLTSDADIPLIPNEYHEYLANGTCARLYRIDNGYRDEERAVTHQLAFDKAVEAARETSASDKDRRRRLTRPRTF